MALTKLTVTVEEDALKKAREYSARHDTSISELVNRFLKGLAERGDEDYPPAIRRLMGILPESADESEHDRYIEGKYGQ